MKLSEQRIGETWIVLTNIIWGFFPIVILLTYSSLTPLYSAAYSVLIAAVFFACMLTYKKQWNELKKKEAWLDILIGSTVNRIIYYVLIYIALQYTTAGNLSIISLMEIFFAFVIFKLCFNEDHNPLHIIGAIIMGIGALIILFPGEIALHKGDWLVLLAAFTAPFGNFFQKRARSKVSAHTLLFTRSFIAGTTILIMAYFLETAPTITNIQSSLSLLLINGILCLEYQRLAG